MSNVDVIKKLSKTKIFASLLTSAIEGDLFAGDNKSRSNAWGYWVISQLREFTGNENRDYFGILLPGKFYSPGQAKESMTPHIELSTTFLETPNPKISTIIANAGNAVLTNAWVYPEIKSFKKALTSSSLVSESEVYEKLYTYRKSLVRELESINHILESDWDEFERLIISSPEKLLHLLSEGFNTKEVNTLLRNLDFNSISINFEDSLIKSSGENSIKRLGIWNVNFVDGKGIPQTTYAITPRLTRNSLFKDSLFLPEKEGILALLIRVLLMRRIYATINQSSLTRTLTKDFVSNKTPAYYKAIVPKVGEKLPEASTDAAILLLQSFHNSNLAWDAMLSWSEGKYILTITESQFKESFEKAKQLLKRAEKPDRQLIDNLLPLCWDSKSRVVRVTFSRAKNNK